MPRFVLLLGATALFLSVLPVGGLAATAAPDPDAVTGSYIVVLRSGDPGRVANEHSRAHNARVAHVYRHALRGYAARMSPRAAERVARDARVVSIDADRVVTAAHHQCGHNKPRPGPCATTGSVAGTVTAQGGGALAGATVQVDGKSATTGGDGSYQVAGVGTGSQTVTASASGYASQTTTVTVSDGATATADFALDASSPDPEPDPNPEPDPEPAPSYEVPTGLQRVFWSDGSVGRTYPGVAILDTGIAAHPDLTVAGGRNCANGDPGDYGDGNGHGTHVAGTAGAHGGIVGVAPGAPLYAVRVLDDNGSGTWSTVICGVDWVTANASRVKVANLSLSGAGTAGTSCSSSSLRQAVCTSVAAGVTYTAAAGNSTADASSTVPAAFPEVITVAALADFDGAPGGGAAATCRTDVDDTVASFSNYGSPVDLIAPGVCIDSTWPTGGYRTVSGTSAASPHAAGAAALWLSANDGASPAAVRSALVGAGNTGYSFTWDGTTAVPGHQWPLLDVGTS